MEAEKSNEIKILYEDKIYELSERELDRVIALASKMLRCKYNSDFINFEDEYDIEVLKQGHKSELYEEMKAELVYAIEEGMFDNYEKRRKETKKEKKQKATALETQELKRIRQARQIIPLIRPMWRIRTMSDDIFRLIYNLD